MAEKCICEPQEVLIFPCSGGSNVGQIANQVAVELTEENIGKMLCLAGIGGHVSGMIESTRVGKRIVCIDGCSLGCAKKSLEHTGIKPTDYIVVTELGIEKVHDLRFELQDVETIKERIKHCLKDDK